MNVPRGTLGRRSARRSRNGNRQKYVILSFCAFISDVYARTAHGCHRFFDSIEKRERIMEHKFAIFVVSTQKRSIITCARSARAFSFCSSVRILFCTSEFCFEKECNDAVTPRRKGETAAFQAPQSKDRAYFQVLRDLCRVLRQARPWDIAFFALYRRVHPPPQNSYVAGGCHAMFHRGQRFFDNGTRNSQHICHQRGTKPLFSAYKLIKRRKVRSDILYKKRTAHTFCRSSAASERTSAGENFLGDS